MRLIAILLSLLCTPSLGIAGAWPREEGELFIAAGGNFLLSDGAQLPVHYDPTLYAEYGLSDRVTIGLDLHTADAGRIGSIFFFASFPIGDLQSQHKFAAILSLSFKIIVFLQNEPLRRRLDNRTFELNGILNRDVLVQEKHTLRNQHPAPIGGCISGFKRI